MVPFAVWAPDANSVDLLLGSLSLPMVQYEGGWWRLAVESAQPGDRYAFSVDGGPGRPDPRSGWQPDGVHGRSAVVDHRSFEWHDSKWGGTYLPGSVLYELHVGTFTPEGTFDSAIERLDHLVRLGVDAIELLPIAEFPGRRGWGYDGVNLFAPHHAYGGPDGLKRLVDACHGVGIGVVVDVVYNHFGPAGNYLQEFGPYLSDRHQTNWGAAVNLDGPGSDEVRRFCVDNALMWLTQYHCDGLRLDAVHALRDDSAVHLLAEMTSAVESVSPHLRRPVFVVVESDLNAPRFVQSRDGGGYGADAAWADEWHHALHAAMTGETQGYYEDFGSLDLLGKALRQAWVYDGIWSTHRRRTHGGRVTGLSGDRFVVFTQNHDQVGNRAQGERSSMLMPEGRLRIAAALLMTSPFTPMIFQGEEWGAGTPWQYFTDFDDPELAAKVTAGRREEFAAFGWRPDEVPDPQDPTTFDRSRLDWSELEAPVNAGIFEWYRSLIALRKRLCCITDGRLSQVVVSSDAETGLLVVRRGRAVLYANLGPTSQIVEVEAHYSLAAISHDDVCLVSEGLLLPTDTTALLIAGDVWNGPVGVVGSDSAAGSGRARR